jgi:hypothetical protein
MTSSPKAPASAAGIVAAKMYHAMRSSESEIERRPMDPNQAVV